MANHRWNIQILSHINFKRIIRDLNNNNKLIIIIIYASFITTTFSIKFKVLNLKNKSFYKRDNYNIKLTLC